MITMQQASELTSLTISTLANMVQDGELDGRVVFSAEQQQNVQMLGEDAVKRLAKKVHIVEFYDEIDDDLKQREQDEILRPSE